MYFYFNVYWTYKNHKLLFSFIVVSKEPPCHNRWRLRTAPSLPAGATEEHAGRTGGGHGSHAYRHRAQDPAVQPAAPWRQGRNPDPPGATERDQPPRVPGRDSAHLWQVLRRRAVRRRMDERVFRVIEILWSKPFCLFFCKCWSGSKSFVEGIAGGS